MYIIDRNFTDTYLLALKDFSKLVIERHTVLPHSDNNQLYCFFSELHSKLGRTLRQKKAFIEDISINPNIVFPYINPKGGERKFYISLGGTINFDQGIICRQSLCLNLMLEHNTKECEDIPDEWNSYPIIDGCHILRRFHFDLDVQNDDIIKPKFHLQYGGNFEPDYLKKNNIHYKLFSPLDHPRLPQQPYDIVMLLDFILREFELGGQEIINDSGWNKHIIQCEKIWLEPYYDAVLTRLRSASRKTPIHRLK
ncbi:hypothetical protein [Shewanella mangrovisoli]|uniref:Uncharacterized protein n=1 Tax=Shewanella mangrovisoli TaxID=2864211 RepID=A0ABV4VPK1_9GAMM